MVIQRNPRMAQLSDPRMRAALYYSRKRRLARLSSDPVDPDFSSVSFLSGFEGTEGGSTFVDEGPNGVSITNVGTPTSLAAAKKFGERGLAVNESGGTTDWLDIGTPAASGCDFGTGDFTIECFFQSVINDATWWHSMVGNFGTGAGSWCFYEQDDGLNLPVWACQGETTLIGTTDLAVDKHHFTISRNGAIVRLFIDGIMEAKATDYGTANVGGAANVFIGGNDQGANDRWKGYVDELRITKGVGRYNSDNAFTVPTAAYPRS